MVRLQNLKTNAALQFKLEEAVAPAKSNGKGKGNREEQTRIHIIIRDVKHVKKTMDFSGKWSVEFERSLANIENACFAYRDFLQGKNNETFLKLLFETTAGLE